MPKLRNIKAVIHDWDDTVVNSFSAGGDYIQRFALVKDLERPTTEQIRRLWGRPLLRMFEELWPNENAGYLLQEFYIFQKTTFCPLPFEGVKETLEHLHAQNLHLCVVSSGRRDQILGCIDVYLKLSKAHHHIATADDCIYHKPDPRVFDSVFGYLSEHGICEEQAIYVGDSIHDYYAARDRGITFIAVTTGCVTNEEFISEGVENRYVLNSFRQLAYLFS